MSLPVRAGRELGFREKHVPIKGRVHPLSASRVGGWCHHPELRARAERCWPAACLYFLSGSTNVGQMAPVPPQGREVSCSDVPACPRGSSTPMQGAPPGSPGRMWPDPADLSVGRSPTSHVGPQLPAIKWV